MSLPAWPGTLPPLVSLTDAGGVEALTPAPLKTEMDDGPARRRRRKLFNETPVQISLMMTHDQFATFQAFVRDTLGHGASAFTASVRVASGALSSRTVEIDGPVSVDDLAVARRVSFKMIVRDY